MWRSRPWRTASRVRWTQRHDPAAGLSRKPAARVIRPVQLSANPPLSAGSGKTALLSDLVRVARVRVNPIPAPATERFTPAIRSKARRARCHALAPCSTRVLARHRRPSTSVVFPRATWTLMTSKPCRLQRSSKFRTIAVFPTPRGSRRIMSGACERPLAATSFSARCQILMNSSRPASIGGRWPAPGV